MKNKIVLSSLALLSLCSCTFLGNRSRAFYLNINNEIDFFQDDWELLYDYNFEHNPGYYVYDCSSKKPNINEFNTERNDLFEERMANYITYITTCLEQNPKYKEYSDEYKPEMIVNFANDYVWKWYLEVEQGRSLDYPDAIKDSAYEEDFRDCMDQIFIVYRESTSQMYVCNWYC